MPEQENTNTPLPAKETSAKETPSVTPASPRSAFVGGESISGSEEEIAAHVSATDPSAERARQQIEAQKTFQSKEFKIDASESKPKEEESTEEPAKAFTIDDFRKAIEKSEEPLKLKLHGREDTTIEAEKLAIKPEATVAKKLPDARDTTGFTPEEVAITKRMSNEAFSAYRTLKEQTLAKAKETEELQKALKESASYVPPNYYENPDAYTLTPEFKTTVNTLNVAKAISDHWEQQIINTEEGGDWQDLKWDGKQYIVQEPQKVTAASKRQLQINADHVRQQINKLQERADTIRQQFSQGHQRVIDSVRAEEKQYFPHLEDPNHPDQAIVKDVINKLASVGLDKSPLANILAKMAAVNLRLASDLQEARRTTTLTQARVDETRKSNPTASSIQGGGKIESQEKPFNINDFKAIGLLGD